MTRSLTQWIQLVLAATPSIIPLLLILHFGVNYHSIDDWDPDMAGFFIKVHNHTATFSDLFAQHNEHRPAVPRLLFLLLNKFTHWNNIPQLLVTWLIVCLTSLCILRLAARTTPRPIGLWFICNLLIFTPAQIENWMWGIGLQNALTTTFLIFGLVVALSSKSIAFRFILCLLLAAAATYTDGSGMLSWPILGLALFWDKKPPRWAPIAWIAACVFLVGAYFVHYTRPLMSLSTVNFYTADPAAIAQYFLTFLGNAFILVLIWTQTEETMFIGTILLALWLAAAVYFLFSLREKNRDLQNRMFPWLLIGSYALASALLAARARAGGGAMQAAVTSRYVSYSIYLPVSLVFLLPQTTSDLARRRFAAMRNAWHAVPVLGLIALLYFQLVISFDTIPSFRRESLRQRQAKGILLLAEVFPDDPELARQVYPDRNILIPEAVQLNEMGYLQPPLIGSFDAQSVRGDQLSAPLIVGRFEAAVVFGNTAQAVGWATVPATRGLADAVFLTYEDDKNEPIIFAAARMGVQRTDLADKEGPEYLYSGWVAEFPVQSLPPAPKNPRITAWALDADTGDAYPLDGAGILPR
jgi:hypothetical protein